MFILVVAAGFFIAYLIYLKVASKFNESIYMQTRYRLIYFSVAIVDLSYFFIAKNTLNVFDCSDVVEGRSVLKFDPSIRCSFQDNT